MRTLERERLRRLCGGLMGEPKFHDLVSFRLALDNRLHRLEQDLKKMTGNIHAQVEQRKALARSNGSRSSLAARIKKSAGSLAR